MKKTLSLEELQTAVKVFGLGERATLREIKGRHRELVKKLHPDTGGGPDEDLIRKVNDACRVLLDYAGSYRFSFTEEEFCEQHPEERIRRQFQNDPLWGKG